MAKQTKDKRAIRRCNSKNRQYNGQKKKDKKANRSCNSKDGQKQ